MRLCRVPVLPSYESFRMYWNGPVKRDIRKTASYLLRSSFFRGVSGPLATLRSDGRYSA